MISGNFNGAFVVNENGHYIANYANHSYDNYSWTGSYTESNAYIKVSSVNGGHYMYFRITGNTESAITPQGEVTVGAGEEIVTFRQAGRVGIIVEL